MISVLLFADAALPASMNAVDALALGIVVISVLLGGFRGITGELARIFALFTAFVVGYLSTGMWQRLAEGAVPAEGSSMARGILVAVGVLITAAAVARLVRWGVKKGLTVLVGQPANAIFGVLVGVARGVVLFASVLFLASFVLPEKGRSYVFEDSVSGRGAAPLVEWARSRVLGAKPASADIEKPVVTDESK